MRIAHTTVLLLALAVSCGRADDHSSGPDFSKYQQTSVLKTIVSVHNNIDWQLNQRSNILAVTDFAWGNAKIADEYFISVNGNGYSWCLTGEGHSGGKRIASLHSAEALKRLTAAIDELPLKDSAPPVERLVVVSFKSGTNWVTHLYDRQSLPKAMLNICEIADLGIETKTQK
jgi:hypothetical protein